MFCAYNSTYRAILSFNTENLLKMPVFSIKAARNYKKLKQYGPAVANYMSVLKYYPEKSKILEREFFDCFKHFCADLETNGKVEEVNEYYLLLAETFKKSRRFFCQWGDFMLRHGLHEEAALCFMKTLSIDEDVAVVDEGRGFYHQAELALTDLRDQLVDQWHFRMLNDLQRNQAYKNAIVKVLSRYDDPSVLDLGCGTGILSMIASSANAKSVYACEHSPIMAYIAKKVLSVNEMDEKVVLFDKTSSSLSVPDVVPSYVDVLVTELMDAGFFGECIVDSLLDAKKRLMSPNGTIVPHKVEIYVVLVECGQIRNENVVDATSTDNAGIVTIRTPFVSALSSRRSENLSEPYESKMMYKIKNNFRYLSEPQLLYTAYLNDVETLENLKNGIIFNFSSSIVADGRLDGVVSWFQVELTEGITISTSPETKTSWEQAVFPMISVEPSKNGDVIEFSVEIRDSWFRLTKMHDDRFADARIVQDLNILTVLNDDITANSYRLFMESHQKKTENRRPLNVTDVSGDPIMPFLAVKSFESNVKVIVDGETSAVIRYLLEDNVEMSSKVSIFTSKTSDEHSKPDKIDVLLCQPIDWTTGLIKQNGLEDILYYKLKYGPDTVIPGRMDVWAMIVESRELLEYARVSDDANTLDYQIKDSINVFDVEIHREIELSTLKHKILSEKRRILSLNFNSNVDDSNGERMPNMIGQRAQREFCVVDDGDCHALIFWYVLNCDECDLSINTSDSMTRFKVAASIMKKTLCVRKNETIVVDANLERSCLKFFVNKKEQ